jgi:hypothetical protein
VRQPKATLPATPFGRRYELERLKKNCHGENTSPNQNSARLWTAAALCRFPFAKGMRVKIVKVH